MLLTYNIRLWAACIILGKGLALKAQLLESQTLEFGLLDHAAVLILSAGLLLHLSRVAQGGNYR